MTKQLTQYYPTVGTFVAAYGRGQAPVYLTMGKDRDLDINGKRGIVRKGETVIGFEWRDDCGMTYRVPGIGFLHHTEV